MVLQLVDLQHLLTYFVVPAFVGWVQGQVEQAVFSRLVVMLLEALQGVARRLLGLHY